MLKSIIYTILILLILNFSLSAVERQVTYSDARVLAMGNAFCAVADDKNMLFFNPAGFATYGLKETSKLNAISNPTLWTPQYNNIGDLTIFSFTYGVDSSLTSMDKFNALKSVAQNVNSFLSGNMTYNQLQDFNNNLSQIYYLPLAIKADSELLSYARHYFGFGLFQTSFFQLELQPAGFLPNLVLDGNADVVLPISFGMPIPNHKNWSMGITYKHFERLEVSSHSLSDLLVLQNYLGNGYYYDKNSPESTFDTIFNGFHPLEAIPQVKIGTGNGIDLGLMYRPAYAWKFGLLLSDVYTRITWWDGTEPSMIPIDARVGAAWTPHFDWFIFSSPIVSSDVEDIFNTQDINFFLKWHFGAEIKMLANVVALRAGINDGYLSLGGGVDSGGAVLGAIGGGLLGYYSSGTPSTISAAISTVKDVKEGIIVGAIVGLFLSKFMEYIPILNYLRPDNIYFPTFNPDNKEFISKNPLCCCLTGILAPITYAHSQIDVSYTGFELGTYPGQIPDYQWLVRISLSYSY